MEVQETVNLTKCFSGHLCMKNFSHMWTTQEQKGFMRLTLVLAVAVLLSLFYYRYH